MKRRFDSSLINFLKELKAFHGSSGNSVVSFPSISGRNVNLYKLFKIVAANGGFDKVSLEEKWPLILEELNIPEECANASEVVKQIYQRYLERYERSRKKDSNGIITDYDIDEIADDDGTKFTPMYKTRRSEAYHTEPRQFFPSEHSRTVTQSQNGPPMPPNFSRLYKSLLSGLPNEFDLGVSACLALSLHDNRIPLLPNHFSLFIDLLCAHAGIFGDDPGNLSNLYVDWRKSDGLKFFKFWSAYVDDEVNEDFMSVKDLLFSANASKFLENEISLHQVAFEQHEIGWLNFPLTSKEGFIVEMIASVFRNLSFDTCNAVLMGGNTTLLRFLLLGSHCKYRSVSALCLDTIARLSPTLTFASMDLAFNSGASMLAAFLRNLLVSNDRAQVLAGAEMLASLCQNDSNFDDLCSFIDSALCNKLFQYLLVPDIHLVVNCAEAIYQISELGPSTCDIIAGNEHHLTLILALTTVEAAAFGPDAIVNIKVVAQHGGAMPAAPLPPAFPQRMQQARMPFANAPRPVAPSQPMMVPFPNQTVQVAFMYASNWLRTVFEPCPPPPHAQSQHSESLIEVYNDYLAAAAFAGNKSVFENVHQLAECISRVFPFIAIKSPPPGRVEMARIFGIRKISTVPNVVGAPSQMMPAVVPAVTPNFPPVLTAASQNGSDASVVNGLISQKRPQPSKTPAEAATVGGVNGGKNVSGILHVVGTPMTAGDMLDRERRQHELAIVRIENKPVPQENGSLENKSVQEAKQNGDHENNKCDMLNELLDEKDGIGNGNGTETMDRDVAVVTNGKKCKPSGQETNGSEIKNQNGKPESNGSEASQHLNGFVHVEGNEATNGHHHQIVQQGCESAPTVVIDGNNANSKKANNHHHHDEGSLASSVDTNNSAAVYASCDSESAASLAGGDASRMSALSDVDSREASSNRRPFMRSCPSVSNTDSRSGAVFNTNSSSHIRQPDVENSWPSQQQSQPPNTCDVPNGPITNSASTEQQPPLPFQCHWNSCPEAFTSADILHRHFVGAHVLQLPSSYGTRSPCLWAGCPWPFARLKWSLFNHVKECHLNPNGPHGMVPQRMTHPDSEIPPDAGLRAVLTNFCQTTPFHPSPPGFEGPVTKQMRLAGGLILRNIAKHSANGKRFVHRHMHELVTIAFSGMESSSAVSAALDLADQPLL